MAFTTCTLTNNIRYFSNFRSYDSLYQKIFETSAPRVTNEEDASTMPAIPLHLPNKDRAADSAGASQALPQLLQTPSGLAILEIQGTVNAPLTSAIDPTAIGKLVFPQYDPTKSADDTSWQKRVYLYVGKHQRLTGEVKKLAKPLAVICRRPVSHDAEGAFTGDNDQLEIAEIVYYKLLFAHRPEPVGSD